jgi:putative tryptophan/tyrosine transport system substrate-binding protein
MRRRELVSLFGSASAAWSFAARAQPEAYAKKIGILTSAGLPQNPVFLAFTKKLRELGYVEGRTITTEFRSASGDISRLNDLAMELVRIPVDLIVTDGGVSVASAAKRATSTIPIVMATAGPDPVSSGLIASLPRPGGNITGFTLLSTTLSTKRLELLREIIPKMNLVGVLWSPTNSAPQFTAIKQAANALSVVIEAAEAQNSQDIPLALDKLVRRGVSALIVLPDGVFWNERKVIVELVAAQSLPAIYPEREYVDAGGLVSYGPSVSENFRRAAVYVDRIFKGIKPADLPVQEPTTFEMIISLKTARTLGLVFPISVLSRADEVIE